MTQSEKLFFHRVANIISKPNIFILNNRWDMAAELEPEQRKKVEHQHKQRSIEFLVNELNCCDEEEALDRVFFVSAKEALQHRMAKNKVMSGEPNSPPTPSHIYQLPGLNERLQSFYTFEKIFAHCLSHTAVQTRFSEPVKSVQSISEEFSASFNRNIELCTEQKIYQQQCLTEWKRRKVLTDQISKDLEKETLKKINLVVKYTEDFLIKAMHDEVNRITTFINEFRWIFDDKDPKTLQEYKTKLFKHVRDCLRVYITTKCSENIHRQVREIDEKMIQGLGDVQNISDTGMADQKLDQAPPCADTVLFEESPLDDDIFSKSFIVDAKSIGADFQEDLTFRFSLGLSKLMVRLQKSKQKPEHGWECLGPSQGFD